MSCLLRNHYGISKARFKARVEMSWSKGLVGLLGNSLKSYLNNTCVSSNHSYVNLHWGGGNSIIWLKTPSFTLLFNCEPHSIQVIPWVYATDVRIQIQGFMKRLYQKTESRLVGYLIFVGVFVGVCSPPLDQMLTTSEQLCKVP